MTLLKSSINTTRCISPFRATFAFFVAMFLLGLGQAQASHPPVLSGVPADVTISCDAQVPAAPAVSATSDCCPGSGVTCFKIENGQLVNGGMNGITYTFTYDNNQEPTSVTITSGNIVSVTIKGGTGDTTYTSGPWTNLTAPINPNTGHPYAISNIIFCVSTGTGTCTPNITFSEVITAGSCPQSYTITRTWTATDACNNSTTASQTITVVDNTAPVLSGVPADASVECDVVPAAANVSASDNCDPNVSVSMTETTSAGSCANSYTIVRTWTATDACGNTSSASQTINVSDNTAPVLSGVPADASAECDEVPTAATVTASDNCDSSPSVSMTETTSAGSCANSYTIVRTWTATDACGNTSSASQTINVSDNTAPVLSGVPADANAECDAVPAAATVTASDNCDSSPSVSMTETTSAGSCANSYTIVRTWTATDACGNTSSASQTINVSDNTAPVLSGVPADANAECDAVPAAANVTASDNCDNNVSVTLSETTTAGSCANSYTLVRTWTATDACGNASSASQTINVSDNTAPVLSGVPADANAECDAVPAAANVTASDNCDANVSVSFDETITAGGCANDYTIVRTWTATDDCGNTSSASQTINVSDNTAPTAVCQSVTIQLDANGDASISVNDIEGGSSDNCSGAGNLSFALSGTAFDCGDVGRNTVVLSVTDECGNTGTCSATVFVEDNIAPVITCPADLSFNCIDDVPAADANDASATDNCPGVTITVSDADNGGSGCGSSPLEIYRTYTATDNSGNTASCTQTITVQSDTLSSGTCDGGNNGCEASITAYWDCENPACVYVTSCKDLSNVVLLDCAGNAYKFEDFRNGDDTAYLCHPSGLQITTVWVKSGCYSSGDGPGYGNRFDFCGVSCPSARTSFGGAESMETSMNVYPNPFSNSAKVELELAEEAHVLVEAFTLTGQKVSTIMDAQAEAGVKYAPEFNGYDLPNGIYLVKLTTSTGIVKLTKVVLSK